MTKKFADNAVNANEYPPKIGIMQGIHAFGLMLPYLWFFDIFYIEIFMVNIPIFLRWLGILDYAVIFIIMIWQMKSLSLNIAASHQDRFLVTSGPYEYVRHPLYVLFVFMIIDAFIITGNLIFVIFTPISIIAAKIRADYEEKELIEVYDEDYRTYQSKTGQLFFKW